MNPQKEEGKITMQSFHRIILVIYIPNEVGFYKNSLAVFKLCLDSLIGTINADALITVVNNGSYAKVSDFLDVYLKNKKIDTLITHTTNIGKIDAQIGAARGSREKYITLSDTDILFVKGWQENVERVFEKFENVGSVSPIPVRHAIYYGTSSVLKTIILNKNKFKEIPISDNFKDYNRYLESINWDLETDQNVKWPVIENDGVEAIIGSGHQILTIDRDILFTTVPSNPSLTLVGNNSEFNYIDEPIDKSGKLRLSTFNNFAFHMGNTVEAWMMEVYQNNVNKEAFQTKHAYEHSTFQLDLHNTLISYKKYNLKKRIIKFFFQLVLKKNSEFKLKKK